MFANAPGWITNNSGSLYTYGDNSVNGNTTIGAFTAAAVAAGPARGGLRAAPPIAANVAIWLRC